MKVQLSEQGGGLPLLQRKNTFKWWTGGSIDLGQMLLSLNNNTLGMQSLMLVTKIFCQEE